MSAESTEPRQAAGEPQTTEIGPVSSNTLIAMLQAKEPQTPNANIEQAIDQLPPQAAIEFAIYLDQQIDTKEAEIHALRNDSTFVVYAQQAQETKISQRDRYKQLRDKTMQRCQIAVQELQEENRRLTAGRTEAALNTKDIAGITDAFRAWNANFDAQRERS